MDEKDIKTPFLSYSKEYKLKAERKISDAAKTNHSVLSYATQYFDTKSNLISAIVMTLSMFIRALLNVLNKFIFMEAKYVNEGELITKINGPAVQSVERHGITTLICLIYVLFFTSNEDKENFLNYTKNHKFLVITRSLLGGLSGFLLTAALQYVSVTSASVAFLITPIITSLLYSCYRKTLISNTDVGVFIISLASSFLIIIPSSENANSAVTTFNVSWYVGMIFLFSFIICGSTGSFFQKIIKGLNIMFAMFLINLFSLILNLFIMFLIGESFSNDITDHLYLMLLGILDFLSMLLANYSINIGNIMISQQFTFTLLPFSMILSYILTGENLNSLMLIGIAIILTVNIARYIYIYIKSERKNSLEVQEHLYSYLDSRKNSELEFQRGGNIGKNLFISDFNKEKNLFDSPSLNLKKNKTEIKLRKKNDIFNELK